MRNVFNILFGNLLIAFAIETLVIENNIIAGGVSGLGIIINHTAGLPVAFVVAIINAVLFFCGFIFMGKNFAAKTLISTFAFPIFLEIISKIDFLKGYAGEPVLASLAAGCLIGTGLALVIKSGASTGGVDVIGVILETKLKVSVRLSLNIIDCLILLLQFPFFSAANIVYGIATVMITYAVMNVVLKRSRKTAASGSGALV